LLGTDFLVVVKDARYPESRRQQGEAAPTIIHHFADTLASVKRTFELRHIICHEAHLNPVVGLDETKELCSACYEFVQASYCGIAHYADPNAPITRAEAVDAATKRFEALEERLEEEEERITSRLAPAEKVAFEEMQRGWRAYTEREGDYNASLNMNGNQGVLGSKLAIEKLYIRRIEDLENIGKTEGRKW
jgi:hypothetical protein